jgi:hypothetical protein
MPACRGRRRPKARSSAWSGICAKGFSPYRRHWGSLAELQQATDQHVQRLARRRLCPATGISVADSLVREQAYLAPLPTLPEPFDIAVTRTVAGDATIGFEQRRYSVPFAWIGRRVEVRGAAGRRYWPTINSSPAIRATLRSGSSSIPPITKALPPTPSRRRCRSAVWAKSCSSSRAFDPNNGP